MKNKKKKRKKRCVRYNYGFGAAGFAAGGANQVKNGLRRLGEVGVFGELGVLLSLFY